MFETHELHTEKRDRHLKTAIAALEKWQGVGEEDREKREKALAAKIESILSDLKQGLG